MDGKNSLNLVAVNTKSWIGFISTENIILKQHNKTIKYTVAGDELINMN